MTARIALVTGANKGIGFEVARQIAAAGLTVLIGSRNLAAGNAAVELLTAEGSDVVLVELDVTSADSMQRAFESIDSKFGRLDLLINNAGIASMGEAMNKASIVSLDLVRQTFETNFFGAVAVTQKMMPLLLRSPAAHIINQSSDLGSLWYQSDRSWKYAFVKPLGYSASKAALNMFTVQLADELRDAGIAVNSANPSSTATDLNGGRGVQTVAEGAAIAVKLALMGKPPSGGFFSASGAEPW